jgi:uncharacterized protein YndB with AHSA1/START domain
MAATTTGRRYGAGLCLAFLTLPLSSAAHAEVLAVAPAGFHLKLERTISAPPEQAWEALLAVGRWWADAHTYSGKGANMAIEPRAGGCFCERFDGGEIEHMRVAYVSPAARQLVMTGGLGPLLWMGASGSLAITLKAVDGGTSMKWEYRVSGFEPKGWEATAPLVDRVLGEQIDRLAAHAAARP